MVRLFRGNLLLHTDSKLSDWPIDTSCGSILNSGISETNMLFYFSHLYRVGFIFSMIDQCMSKVQIAQNTYRSIITYTVYQCSGIHIPKIKITIAISIQLCR